MSNIPLCTRSQRVRQGQQPAGPASVDWKHVHRWDPNEPVVLPYPQTQSPVSDETKHLLEPSQDQPGYIEPGPGEPSPGYGGVGDSGGPEAINVPQDDQRELVDRLPEDQTRRKVLFQPWVNSDDDRPPHKPKRTHVTYDSQQDEAVIPTDTDNNFVETAYPFAPAGRRHIMPRLAILRGLAQIDTPKALELVKKFKAGDVAAGHKLLLDNSKMIREVVNRRLFRYDESIYDKATQDDILNDAIVDVLDALPKYDGRSKLSTYIWMRADSSVLDSIREIERDRAREPYAEEMFRQPGESFGETPPWESVVPGDPTFDISSLYTQVDAALARLPKGKQRDATWFRQHYFEHTSLDELAEEYGVGHGTIHRNIQQILEWLRVQPEIELAFGMEQERMAHVILSKATQKKIDDMWDALSKIKLDPNTVVVWS